MPSPQESLIHEAASLFRLVDSVDRFVAESQNVYTYTNATESFLRWVRTRASDTKLLVSAAVQQPTEQPEEIDKQYNDLIIQKDRWKLLHTYVKPASDAHTLALPVALIHLAAEHLRTVKGMETVELVALLTHDLMYYHNSATLKDLDDRVYVELPYSQGPSFFTNLIIYHELGHYIFQRISDSQPAHPLYADLAEAMDASFNSKLGQHITTGNTKTWARAVLKAWAREIFCDLFAIRFLGPAFTFALIDILSLLGLMREGTEVTFDEEHPAPALRFGEQIAQLDRDEWWGTIDSLPSDHIHLSKRLASRKVSDCGFVFRDERIPGFIEAFIEIVPRIHPLVAAITPDPRKVAHDFRNRRADIEKCLLEGVVPSHLMKEGSTDSPLPVSIINAAYSFYLTSMPKLIDKLIDQKASNLDQRSDLTAKLESWTLKALEDCQLYAEKGRTC